MEITIKDLIPIATILGALIAFHVKVFYNLFVSIVKMSYKEVPGKQTLFDAVIQWSGYIGFTVYFIIGIFSVAETIQNGYIAIIVNSKLRCIYTFLTFICITFIIGLSIVFIYLLSVFHEKMRGYRVIISDKIRKFNKINIYVFLFAIVMYLKFILSEVINDFTIENGKYMIFKDYIQKRDIAVFVFQGIVFSTSLLIAINLKKIIEDLKSNDIYILYFEDEEVYCGCYLEFKDYYLVIKNEEERYISKSKVKEVRKIKQLN